MALHEQSAGATDEWYTPGFVFEAMNARFDLDPCCAPMRMPAHDWCEEAYRDNGLAIPWRGFVWMNAPFGGRNGLAPWLEKFHTHGNGVALVPDRTSAPWWQAWAPRMDLVLFVSRKIKFIDADGQPGRSPAQGTALLAMGAKASLALFTARSTGLGSIFAPIR